MAFEMPGPSTTVLIDEAIQRLIDLCDECLGAGATIDCVGD